MECLGYRRLTPTTGGDKHRACGTDVYLAHFD
jgi:hypothetical protein